MVDAVTNLQEIFELEDNTQPLTSYESLNHTHSHLKALATDILISDPGTSMKKSENICSKDNSAAEHVFQFSANQTNDNVIRYQWCFKLGLEAQSCFKLKSKQILNAHYIKSKFISRNRFPNHAKNSSCTQAWQCQCNSHFHKMFHPKNFVGSHKRD